MTDAGKVVGLMARRQIAAGMPLNEALLDKPPLVKSGNAVMIMARIGDITVTASGKALQEGGEGEIVRVQNLSSNKILTARVVDKATVEVIIYSGR
jgi:flagella basal body P-ring formation protein FlgA